MPSNDDVVFGIPSVQCPSCGSLLDLSQQRIDKFSKEQRRPIRKDADLYETAASRMSADNAKAEPSHFPQHNFIVVTCSNMQCEQYDRVKVFRIPRMETPSTKVNLG